MGNFKSLRVWQKAKDAAIEIYRVTNKGNFSKDFRFKDQIRAAGVSVLSNIAEGDELDTNKQAVRHFYIAKGSAAEVITQLIIAKEIGYVLEEDFTRLINEYEDISSILAKLIKARR